MKKKNVIEIKEEVKVGNVILEKGDKIEVLEEDKITEEYSQFEDFSEYVGLTGTVSVIWKNRSTLAFVKGTLEIGRPQASSSIQIPLIRNRGQSEAQFNIIGGEVNKFSNGFSIKKDDIEWLFIKK